MTAKRLSSLLIIIGIVFLLLTFMPVLKDEIWYALKNLKGQKLTLGDHTAQKDSVFARFLTSSPINIEPVNKDFALVIEKIGVNAPVIADVPVLDEAIYNKALESGIAHAASSDYPSDKPGNVYMFAHASVNLFSLGKYATVFNLLRKLDLGDKVYVFYKGDSYAYEVMNKEYFKGWTTHPLTRSVVEPILTLQTCDPPGTTFNRLILTAKLVKKSVDTQGI